MAKLWEAHNIAAGIGVPVEGETVTEIFWNSAAKRAHRVFMRQKNLGIWQSYTWEQTAQAVAEIANGLMSLGLQKGDVVSIAANTMVEWLLADMAIMSCAAISNGIYPTDAAAQVQYLCADSKTRVLMVEDDEQLDKALQVRESLPDLQHIIVFDMEGLADLKEPDVISLAALREMGRQFASVNAEALTARRRSCAPDDVAILVYTSGTTGKPKGAMHLHGGIVHAMRGNYSTIAADENDEKMAFLPLCHIAERMGGAFLSVYTGAVLNFVENPQTVPENVREISPTIFTAVPRVWEKLYSGVMIALKESGKLQQAAYAWSIGVGRRVAEHVLKGEPVPGSLKAQYAVAEALALRNVRKLIGIDQARFLLTGAAPISADLVRWYLALGVPMLEVWGMTETCGASTYTPPARIKPGMIGPSAHFNEVKCDPESGEIMVRGKNVFAGYLNLPDKTAETIDSDGWLHTGDVGFMDADGYFKITDRMKDIIITAGGKNITPSEFENELKFSPYITDAVVIGDKRPYLVAIVMIDQDNVEKYAQDNDIPFSNYASLTRTPEITALIQSVFDGVNAKFARVEQVKKFWLLDNQLTAEDEELTPTMKLKRAFVAKKYAPQIEAMY